MKKFTSPQVFFFSHSSTLSLILNSLEAEFPKSHIFELMSREFESTRDASRTIRLPRGFYEREDVFVPFFRELIGAEKEFIFIIPHIGVPALNYLYKINPANRIRFAEEGTFFHSRKGRRLARMQWRNILYYCKNILTLCRYGHLKSAFFCLLIRFEGIFLGLLYLPKGIGKSDGYSILPSPYARNVVELSAIEPQSNFLAQAVFIFFPNFSQEKSLASRQILEKISRIHESDLIFYTEHPSISDGHFSKMIPKELSAERIESNLVFSKMLSVRQVVVYSSSESMTLYTAWLCASGYPIQLVHFITPSKDLLLSISSVERESGLDILSYIEFV